MNIVDKTVDRALNKFEIIASFSVAAIITDVFIRSFVDDIYNPVTNGYIFPNLFEDLAYEQPGKEPIRYGDFMRKVIIWAISIIIFAILF